MLAESVQVDKNAFGLTDYVVLKSYLPMIRSLINREKGNACKHVDYKDMEAEALFGLVKAHSRYAKSGGASPTTWAHIRIRGAIKDVIRTEWHRANKYQSIDDVSNFVKVDEKDVEQALIQKDLFQKAMQLIYRSLPREQVHVVVSYYLRGRTDAQIAVELGCCAGKVGKLRSIALASLRAKLPQ